MSNTNSSNINSKSYIRIVCDPDSNPEINVIELRDEKHTRIGLHPGENIITVEEYPELKYGFLTSQRGENGFLTHYIDLDMSNFDGSNMVTMEDMFARATFDYDDIKPINFGNLDTSNVIDMSRMFKDSTMEWFEFKPLFNTSSVTKMDEMFDCYTNYETVLDLSGFDVSNVKSMKRMFSSWGKKIILDGWKINNKEVVRDLFDVDCCNGIPDITVSLKKCDPNTIKWIAEELTLLVCIEGPENDDSEPHIIYSDGDIMAHLILDKDVIAWYEYKSKEVKVLTNVQNKSFIKIGCALNADPQKNKIQLKDENKTIIELQPGVNILSVEEYPELKYGFEQVSDWTEASDNGLDIFEINFDYFDWSEVKDTFRMLLGMKNIKWCSLEDDYKKELINNPNVTLKWHKEESAFTIHKIKSSVKGVTYSKDGKILLKVDKNKSVLFVKDGVQKIAKDACRDCSNLRFIFLPNTLKVIGSYAFSGCTALKRINIPDSVVAIDSEAFYNCRNLKRIYLGKNVKIYGYSPFSYSGIMDITLPMSNALEDILMEFNPSQLTIYSEDFSEWRSSNLIGRIYESSEDWPNICLTNLGENIYPCSIDGCVLDMTDYNLPNRDENDDDDEGIYYDALIATKISPQSFVIPEGVEVLDYNSLCDKHKMLYLPDSVEFIHPEVFGEHESNLATLIIKRSYFNKIMEIIPYSFGNVNFRLI